VLATTLLRMSTTIIWGRELVVGPWADSENRRAGERIKVWMVAGGLAVLLVQTFSVPGAATVVLSAKRAAQNGFRRAAATTLLFAAVHGPRMGMLQRQAIQNGYGRQGDNDPCCDSDPILRLHFRCAPK